MARAPAGASWLGESGSITQMNDNIEDLSPAQRVRYAEEMKKLGGRLRRKTILYSALVGVISVRLVWRATGERVGVLFFVASVGLVGIVVFAFAWAERRDCRRLMAMVDSGILSALREGR